MNAAMSRVAEKLRNDKLETVKKFLLYPLLLGGYVYYFAYHVVPPLREGLQDVYHPEDNGFRNMMRGVVYSVRAYWPNYIICLAISWITGRFTFQPSLKKIPRASAWAENFRYWMLWKRWRGEDFDAVHEAHLKHGPIVRIGVDEISVNQVLDGVAIVHGSSGFDKTDWYDHFINHGRQNVFSSSTPSAHNAKRRLSARVYGKSYLQRSPHVMHILATTILDGYVPLVEREGTSPRGLDVLQVNLAYGLDVVTGFIWGQPVGTDMVNDVRERDEWARMYQDAHPPASMFWLLELPRLTKVLRWLIPGFIPKSHYQARRWMEEWTLRKVDASDEAASVSDLENSGTGTAPLVYGQIRRSLLSEKDGEKGDFLRTALSPTQRLDAASECLDHLYATRDTFGITLSYIMFALSRQPALQDRLHTELTASLPPAVLSAVVTSSSTSLSTLALSLKLPSILESFELLNAVIREGLRLRNIPPLAQPRRVPDGGSATLCGYEVPEGTKVSTYATSTHLMPTIFDQPHVFEPDRWLQRNRARVRNMENNFWPMGMGSRICLGQHLAMETVAYVRYSTNITDDKDFGNGGGYISGGPNDHLFLGFQARENAAFDEPQDII